MLYVFTAMYCEAKSIIDKLNLKKDNSIKKFQVFKKDNVVLTITGIGNVYAFSATSYIAGKFNISEYDTFINIGICGTVNKNVSRGDLIIGNKVIDSLSRKCFYPDMIKSHDFLEGSIESFIKVVNEKELKNVKGEYIDMEAAFFFQAANIFLPPHKIYCIKVVSDYLDGEFLTKDKVFELISYNVDKLLIFFVELNNFYKKPKSILSEKDKNLIDSISCKLKLSTSMKEELIKLFKGYKIRNKKIDIELTSFYDIECKSKYEGKKYFGEISEKLKSI